MSDAAPPSRPAAAARTRPTIRARVVRIFDHADDTRSLFLAPTAAAMPRYLPGMFISIAIALGGETRVRPYTIASSPEDGTPFEICFNRVPGGAGAAWLFARALGDEIEFTGPFGAFALERAPAAETIFIAEGTAIAPIRPMVRRALAGAHRNAITLLYGADRAAHILYRAEFEQLATEHAQFHFVPSAGGPDADAAYVRLIDEARRRWVAGDADRSRHFYLCGVGPRVLELRDLLRGAGYERRAVHYEQW
ncbi:MAG: FAD-dependent oxidoreductase [Candidatus Binataceae bacterium]|nr:FAD-dependent oxidoreductase [Candidatus Binataceae bacterium]